MNRASSLRLPLDRVGTRLSRYGTWIACCLGRGERAPLSPADVQQLAGAPQSSVQRSLKSLEAAGLVSSWVRASKTPGTEGFRQAAAFTQGIEFLGEAMLLSGIAFLLGTILAALREGGGEVQASLGVPVTTLKMPATAKAFLALMMMGLMVGIAQFVLYLVAMGSADDPASFSAWLNWLGPFRELSLGLILAGIVLALVTIGNMAGFQFDRVKSMIHTGR